MGGWNQGGDPAITVSSVSSFNTKGLPATGDHLTQIQGSMTNNFGHDDAWCYNGSFKLIGQGETVEPASGECASFHVAPGTETHFAFYFPVNEPGSYELRFERFTSSPWDQFMRKTESQTINVK